MRIMGVSFSALSRSRESAGLVVNVIEQRSKERVGIFIKGRDGELASDLAADHGTESVAAVHAWVHRELKIRDSGQADPSVQRQGEFQVTVGNINQFAERAEEHIFDRGDRYNPLAADFLASIRKRNRYATRWPISMR